MNLQCGLLTGQIFPTSHCLVILCRCLGAKSFEPWHQIIHTSFLALNLLGKGEHHFLICSYTDNSYVCLCYEKKMPVYCYTYQPTLAYLWNIGSNKNRAMKSICERLALDARGQLGVESTDTIKRIFNFFQDLSE